MATTENGGAGQSGDAHHGPLDQFAINRYIEIDLGGFDASFTNSALMMCVTVALITLLTTLGMGRGRMVPGRRTTCRRTRSTTGTGDCATRRRCRG